MSANDDPRDSAAIALDLGSTRIKAGRIDAAGALCDLRAVAAPALCGEDPIREGDALEYIDAALALVRELVDETRRDIPLGVASQRSSFVLWDALDGRPRTPLISWQDRRAASWCETHQALRDEVERISGLPLSAHYAGPKLATLQHASAELRRGLHDGRLRFGNLETLLFWRLSAGSLHETDLSMAARTQLVDLGTSRWSETLRGYFDVSPACLPAIAPSVRHSALRAGAVTIGASLADQAAGVLAVLPDGDDTMLVSLGTGAFVLRRSNGHEVRRPGYLSGPLFGGDGTGRFAIEGAINGAGPALGRFGRTGAGLPRLDPSPRAFALPDLAGLGAPHWRPSIRLSLSPEARALDRVAQRRIVLEGLLFRLREVIDDLDPHDEVRRLILTGGLTAEPDLAAGLATLVGRPVQVLDQPEGVLLGAGRAAAGMPIYSEPAATGVPPGRTGAYLLEKYRRWRGWLARLLD